MRPSSTIPFSSANIIYDNSSTMRQEGRCGDTDYAGQRHARRKPLPRLGRAGFLFVRFGLDRAWFTPACMYGGMVGKRIYLLWRYPRRGLDDANVDRRIGPQRTKIPRKSKSWIGQGSDYSTIGLHSRNRPLLLFAFLTSSYLSPCSRSAHQTLLLRKRKLKARYSLPPKQLHWIPLECTFQSTVGRVLP
ncbi:hypothetical protein N658DRAFT_346414 [Parathielavia hyrcaniae]|uniref:Uncharacterized protein n=1 Tax=Parathielavia hyrcaniae TaxID=113614 RepID=A0AAN6PRX4_9PEZI|nr:hypothetical protein N658DRAFT_346414 [Parathielavia hyrcaniae]